ncbi:4-(cytidine 5'-diphospho)-2-C-methyl-D-erythritol kinase [Aminipila terrae]|uniref:4-(Cytidine 5'-diphospho)-2-C-methyl-D-erythritol kinase n=1 Tax=Aminipila terrae TaxID=2697030 RepID=A0A6P1MKF0_9FIRM|nr:hypothetical protein [Aminipila terrae]QHI72116.1 hypothetical protein Ami3637_06610 [Aminipila terrae]
MNEIMIKSYAKINLSLDVLGVLSNGYHQVEMVMQQLELHDRVTVKWKEDRTLVSSQIVLSMNRDNLPLNSENIAYRAAEMMLDQLHRKGKVEINIEKIFLWRQDWLEEAETVLQYSMH